MLYRTYILNQTEENSLKYKTYNNKIRSILRQEENNYYKKIFNEKENGIKQMWKYLGPILNPAKKVPKVIPLTNSLLMELPFKMIKI